jgi:hypothetical protein
MISLKENILIKNIIMMIGNKLFKERENMDVNIYLLLQAIFKMLINRFNYANYIAIAIQLLGYILVELNSLLISRSGQVLKNTFKK